MPEDDIMKEVGGTYEYYAYVLTDFNPIEAEKLIETCSIEQITKAMMARYLANKPPEDAKN